jgi:hypothetical protein
VKYAGPGWSLCKQPDGWWLSKFVWRNGQYCEVHHRTKKDALAQIRAAGFEAGAVQ